MYVLSNKEMEAAYTYIEYACARKTHKDASIIPILIYPYLAMQYRPVQV